MNGEWKISWIKQQERLPIAVMEMAIPHGKHMYTTRQPLSEKALYTGHIGDGKIFVYNVTRVVKIRTGEEDFAALQDVE